MAREKQNAGMWRPCVEAMDLDCAAKEENVDVCYNSKSLGHDTTVLHPFVRSRYVFCNAFQAQYDLGLDCFVVLFLF